MRTGLHTMQIASANNVHRTPEVDHFAFQLRVHLVQVPMPEAEPGKRTYVSTMSRIAPDEESKQ